MFTNKRSKSRTRRKDQSPVSLADYITLSLSCLSPFCSLSLSLALVLHLTSPASHELRDIFLREVVCAPTTAYPAKPRAEGPWHSPSKERACQAESRALFIRPVGGEIGDTLIGKQVRHVARPWQGSLLRTHPGACAACWGGALLNLLASAWPRCRARRASRRWPGLWVHPTASLSLHRCADRSTP